MDANTPTPGSRNSKLLTAAFFVFVFVAAFIVRRHDLDESSFWLDEIHQSNCTSLPVSQIWSKSPANKPPLDYYIQAAIMGRTTDEMRGRIHACAIGAGLVVLLGALGLAVGGWRYAWIMVSLALSLPVLIRYSQEGRPYILLLFSECLFFLVLWKTMTAPKPIAGRWWAAMAGTIVLCMWSHFLSLFACAAALVFVIGWIAISPARIAAALSELKRQRTIVALIAVAAVVALAWLPLHARAAKAAVEDFYAPFNREAWKGMIRQYLDIYSAGYEWYQYTPGGHKVLVPLMAAGWLGWTLRKRALFANFCLVMFAANFFGMFAFYRLVNHWMEMRYTLSALLPALLLAGMGVETILAALMWGIETAGKYPARERARIEAVALALVCLVTAGGFTGYVVRNPFLKADWRGLGKLLEKNKKQPMAVMTAAHQDATAVRHYIKRYGIDTWPVNYNFNLEVLETYILFNENVFAVWGIMGVNPDDFEKQLDDFPLHKVRPRLRYLDVRQSARPKDILARANLGDEKCPLLVGEWGKPEELDRQKARPMLRGRGALCFDAPRSRELTIAFAVRPDAGATTPTLSLRVNGTKLPGRKLHVDPPWNLAAWKIDKQLVRQGRNVVELETDTTAPLRVRDMKVIAWHKK